MGLFQKSKSANQTNDELGGYVDNLLKNSGQPTNEEIDEHFSIENMSLNKHYSIDHAVELMRELPDHGSDVVVTVVAKTLQSANINVNKIIDDAKDKEASLEAQIRKLNEEIEMLQTQIADKKEQISVSNATLEETRKVRGLLETSEAGKEKAGKTGKNQHSQPNAINSTVKGAIKSADAGSRKPDSKLAVEAQT